MYDIKTYTEADTIQEAVGLLKDNENAQIIAGGTDVLIKSRERKKGYVGRDLIGITRIPELKEIKTDSNGDIIIGAAATFTEVELNETILKNMKSFSNAVGSVGGPQIRNVGTVGGNICNGATSADSASTLFAYNAVLMIAGKDGNKEIEIKDFYLGPGKVLLEQGEILTAVKIKKENYDGYNGHYIKFSPRQAMDIATLGCSVLLKENNGIIEDIRIAYGVAGPTPLRAQDAEEYAKGKPINDETLDEIGKLCLGSARARDSWRASKAFREQLVEELPKRAVKAIIGGGR